MIEILNFSNKSQKFDQLAQNLTSSIVGIKFGSHVIIIHLL